MWHLSPIKYPSNKYGIAYISGLQLLTDSSQYAMAAILMWCSLKNAHPEPEEKTALHLYTLHGKIRSSRWENLKITSNRYASDRQWITCIYVQQLWFIQKKNTRYGNSADITPCKSCSLRSVWCSALLLLWGHMCKALYAPTKKKYIYFTELWIGFMHPL